MVLVLSFAILIGLMIEFRSTTSRPVRFGMLYQVLVLITGGIVSPMWAVQAMPSSDEMTLMS